jgi:RimJ/RimL family protein N-acetyltransferase
MHPSQRAAVPTLTDGVVRLDGFTLEDVEAQLAGEDEETARRFGWWPKRSTPETVAAAIGQWSAEWAAAGPVRAFAVRAAATGALVGHCELRLQDAGIAHVSYSTGRAHRGRGYASRALRLLSEWAFRAAGVERLELYAEPDNAASRGVARKAGFHEEGLLRKQGRGSTGRHDMILHAKLPTDP